MPPSETTQDELFGHTRLRPATGNHQPDMTKLRAPLTDPEAVTRLFCFGCGATLAINAAGAEGLKTDFSLDLPLPLAQSFFLAKRCLACAGHFQEVTLCSL